MNVIDRLLLSMLPALIVMSVLVILLPSLRGAGSGSGIIAAWLAAFGVALVVAFTHTDDWSLDCGVDILRTGPTSFGAQAGTGRCTNTNTLPLWLVALPPLVGITILLAWVGRHTRPLPAALRAIGGILALTVVIVSVGQASQNAALLLLVAVGVGAYAWPCLARHRAT